MATSSLVEAFVNELRRGHALRPPPDLESRLAELVETGRQAWPEIALPPTLYVGHIARRLADNQAGAEDLRARLASLPAADLYLACACLAGDPAALRYFEATYGPVVETALVSLRFSVSTVQELRQEILCRLLVGEGTTRPILDYYSGRGDLQRWLRSVALRAGARRLRRGPRVHFADQAELIAVPATGGDPEIVLLKAAYGPEFREALSETLAGLAVRERTLLRQRFLDGLTTVQLGRQYRVNPGTISRWVSAACGKILAGTRARLAHRLQLSESDVDSVMRLVRSRIETGLRELLPALGK